MYKGIGGSSGYGIGKIVIIKNDMPVYEIKSPENKENEIKRFLQAVDKFIEKTTKMAEHMRKTAGEKNAEIIEGHIIMLSDPFMQDEIKDKINSGMCAEEAVDKVCEQFIEMFTMTDDELTVQRAADIKDIRLRLLKILTGDRDIDISEVPKGSIIVAKDLTPSMTAGIVKENVEGIITQAGGFTSHSAILARALEIPGVFSVDDITDNARDGMEAVIDGKEGCVILNPSKEEITEYTAKKEKYLKDKEELNKYRNKATKTADSIEIELFGNIGKPEDAKNVKDNDGEGIGLFRTEFLFMENTQIPSEEEQFEAYKKTAVMMDGKEVIIRTLDVGGDKNIPYLGMEKEDNPFLGFRAVRYCLDRKEMYKIQLRALIRASVFGKLKIMIPLVTCVNELREVKVLVEDIKADLRANFNGECSEVGMYLAMSRVAFREGYPEIGLYWEKAAFEEAEHAAKFAELLGEVVTDSTKKNLEMRVEAENGATAGKTDLAKRAKALNLDAIHDTVHEMARDEARHGKAFAGLLKRYFGK